MKVNNKENIQSIKENPKFVLQSPETRHWNPNTLRFLRVAITNHLNVDPTRIYEDEKYRAKFTKLCITGAHEAAHMRGARQVGDNVEGQVFENGNGITRFKLQAVNLYQYVRDINYIGYLGKSAEEALGETPHGHGFDMAQNDAFADHYSKRTGNSGSAIQSEAANWARSETRSNLDSIVDEGVRLALLAA